MLGAIIGDIVGSPYEFRSEKTKDFMLFSLRSRPTDDSVMTIATGCACVEADLTNEAEFKKTLTECMRELGRQYLNVGYGDRFYRWLISDSAEAYGSFGNGSAMRVSPTAWAADTLEEAERLAKWSAEITHNHPEGIKGAQAVAAAIFLARTGAKKDEIRQYIDKTYYPLDFTLDGIRETYAFNETCQGSVPQAIECFLEAADFEDAVRGAVSLGGDTDTQAAIAGSIAEAYFGIPRHLREEGLSYLDDTLLAYYRLYAVPLYGRVCTANRKKPE